MQTEHPNPTSPRDHRGLIAAAFTALLVLSSVVALSAGRASTPDETHAVRAVIRQHTKALAGGDSKAYCRTLTREARILMEIVMFDHCETAVGLLIADNQDLLNDPVHIERVEVRGDLATAVVRYDGPLGTAPVTLRKLNGRWLVDLEPNEPKRR